jgi:hypothetical protein
MNNVQEDVFWYNHQCNRLFYVGKALRAALLLYRAKPNDITLRLTADSLYNDYNRIVLEVVSRGHNGKLFVEQSKRFIE